MAEVITVDEAVAAVGLPPVRDAVAMNGFDASVWRADLVDGRVVAVRVLRPGVSAAAELDMLRLAGEHGHPVPAIVADGHHDGRDVVVMTWCSGSPIGDLLDASTAHALGTLFGRAHADLHRPLDGAGHVLCHRDYQPFNVLTDGVRVTGIVDWSNAAIGDPRTDLAWTAVVLPLGATLLPELADGLSAFAAAWREGYAEQRAMPTDDELRPFLARAAARQLADWTPRAATGGCPPAVLDAARELVERWRA